MAYINKAKIKNTCIDMAHIKNGIHIITITIIFAFTFKAM